MPLWQKICCLSSDFVLELRGVAIATDLATALSAALVRIRLRKTGMLPLGKWHSQWKIGWEVLKTGVPSAVQGAVFCFANLFVQASINSFGSIAIAGSTIAMNFEYFAYYGITAFGQTATTFVGQNHAAGQLRRCRNILWISLGFSVLCSLVLIVPIVLFRDFFAGFFSTEAAVIQSAGERILCILLFEPMCSLYEIPTGVLRGSGHPVLPMASTMLGTCAFRIVWIFTAFGTEPSPAMLYHGISAVVVCDDFIGCAQLSLCKTFPGCNILVSERKRMKERTRGESRMLFSAGSFLPAIHPAWLSFCFGRKEIVSAQ